MPNLLAVLARHSGRAHARDPFAFRRMPRGSDASRRPPRRPPCSRRARRSCALRALFPHGKRKGGGNGWRAPGIRRILLSCSGNPTFRLEGKRIYEKEHPHAIHQRTADGPRHPDRERGLRGHHGRIGVHGAQDGRAALADRVRGHRVALLPQGARPRQGEPQRGERHAHRHERGRHGGGRPGVHHPRHLDAGPRRRRGRIRNVVRGAFRRGVGPDVHGRTAQALHRGRRAGIPHRRSGRPDARRRQRGRQDRLEAVRVDGPCRSLHGPARRRGRDPGDALRQRGHPRRRVRHLQLPHAAGRRLPGGHGRGGRVVRRRAAGELRHRRGRFLRGSLGRRERPRHRL